MELLQEKYNRLIEQLKSLKQAAVAFSGGVDSTFLLYAAKEALGSNVIAITARSLSFPGRELTQAKNYSESLGIEHFVLDSEELELDGFSENPKNRCYLCKTELFTKIRNLAKSKGIDAVLEASNSDDNGDYRPGLIAVKELEIYSPLRQVGFTKDEIRILSKEYGLPTWNKPSFACLASRFPYGESITPERLIMIDKAEQFLLDLGFWQLRVRFHEKLARIETDEAGFALMLDPKIRNKVYEEFRKIGFIYVSLDLKGYRTGSMNETLSSSELSYGKGISNRD
jgi:pyridinium-3,5-biscarboxylic acid mononucleotide sulfurtransferase